MIIDCQRRMPGKRIQTAKNCVILSSMYSAIVMIPSMAFAQASNMGDVSLMLFQQLTQVGDLIVGGALIVGIVLIIAGLLKLKQASDTQGQQVKWADGIWRIVVGVGLVSILYFTRVGAATFGLETDANLGGSTMNLGFGS